MGVRLIDPGFPDLALVNEYFQELSDTRVLSNGGKFCKLYESKFQEVFETASVVAVSNATLGLAACLMVVKASAGETIRDQVVVCSFGFKATADAVLLAGCNLKLVDCDEVDGNMSISSLESIDPNKVLAIMPVHAYGKPVNYAVIEDWASKYGVSVIYDACHALGVKDQDKMSILNRGRFSVISTHATKILSTGEGGCVVCNEASDLPLLRDKINFSLLSGGPGLNAKLDEFRAAIGFASLNSVRSAIEVRRKIAERYLERLDGLFSRGLARSPIDKPLIKRWNGSYMPVVFSNRVIRDRVSACLASREIGCREYFSPPLTEFFLPEGKMSRREDRRASLLSQATLCLPMHNKLTLSDVDHVVDIVTMEVLASHEVNE